MAERRNIAGVILGLAMAPLHELDVSNLVTDLCSNTAETLGLAGVAVYLVDDGARSPRLAAASDTDAWLLGQRQERDSSSPVHKAASSGQVVAGEDGVVPGVGATAVVPVRWEQSLLGCVQIVADGAVVRPDDLRATDSIAAALGMLLFNARNYQNSTQLVMQLSSALRSRLPIEQAKGRLMERYRVDLGEAYRLLRGHARRNRISIGDAAAAVVAGQGVSTGRGGRGAPRHRPLPG